MAQRYQVVIVGGGPVGMGLAVELGQRNITCAVIERNREVSHIPKGQGLKRRAMEHFFFWNCSDAMRDIRRTSQLVPPGYSTGGVHVYESLMGDHWFKSIPTQTHHDPYYFQKNEWLPQYLTEEVLRNRVAELPSVTVLYEYKATGVTQDETSAQVTVAAGVWPYEEEVLEADYVVGCDGTGSTVVSQLGFERHGTDFDQRMVLAVFTSPELHALLERFGERTTYHAETPRTKGAWQLLGRIEVGKSWFYHGPVAKDTSAEDRDYVHEAIELAVGHDFPAEFEFITFWNLRISVADDYRKGRVFIAGDAAHSHPPYGAFGLNSGLEDVVNLGWKLACVLNGLGDDALLDSYSTERQPVFAETGEDVIATLIREDRDWLDQHTPEREGEYFAEMWQKRAHAIDPHASYEVHYAASPIVFGPPDGTTGIHSDHSFSARAGHHLSPQLLSSGRNIFEELGPDFTLIALDADPKWVEDFVVAAKALRVPLKVVTDSAAGGRENYGCHLILVRPDQFVVWRGDESPVDVGQILRTSLGSD